MTLDPVHIDGIARMARRLGDRVDTTDHDDLAETVWSEFLDPLVNDGNPILEPIDSQFRREAELPDIGLIDRPFDTTHGLDSGTINPTTFKNGLILDVAQAAMAAHPSDLDLHRARSVVLSAHTNDQSLKLGDEHWRKFDEGYTQKRVLQVPDIDRYAQRVVHALALYLAESQHALEHVERVSDLLVLDGPIYPTGLLNWADSHPDLRGLLESDDLPGDVLENYIRLVETCIERDIPVVGFVKNSKANGITRHLQKKTPTPWSNDNALFERVLTRREDGDIRTDAMTYTNWFRSRIGTDRVVSRTGDALGVRRDLDPEAYEVTFFAIFDPRDELLYRVEAPYAVTRDSNRRERLARHLVADVAAERGPPVAIAKADELARIDATGKQQLRERIGQEFESDRQQTYNQRRWGPEFDETPGE